MNYSLQEIRDRLAIHDRIVDLFIHTDRHDWTVVEDSFAGEVLLDYTSLSGGQAVRLSPHQIVDAWKGLLPGFHCTHHQLGNFIYDIRQDEATVFCYGNASHYLPNGEGGGDLWTIVGSYDFHLLRAGEDWKIDLLKFNFKCMDGNVDLPGLARRRVGDLR